MLQNSLTQPKKQLLLEKKEDRVLFSCSQDSIKAMSFLCREKQFSCHFTACIWQTIHTNFIHHYVHHPFLSSFTLLQHVFLLHCFLKYLNLHIHTDIVYGFALVITCQYMLIVSALYRICCKEYKPQTTQLNLLILQRLVLLSPETLKTTPPGVTNFTQPLKSHLAAQQFPTHSPENSGEQEGCFCLGQEASIPPDLPLPLVPGMPKG